MSFMIKTTYDKEADSAYIYLDEGSDVFKTVEFDEDIILDMDCDDRLIGIELKNYSAKYPESEPELRPEFIENIKKIEKRKNIPVDDFRKRYGLKKK